MYCVTFSREPYVCMNNACATDFNFPYRHSENSEPGELRMLGAGLGPDNFTDPMEREDVVQLL